MARKITPMSVSIHPDSEHPVFGAGVLHLSLQDDAGGYYFELKQICTDDQGEQMIRIELSELELCVQAGKKLLRGVE
jgi:hypothetical protein